ncbi:MAG: hypothetical protein ACP5E3_07145 [Bacteroidales bacterium]
MKKLVYLIAFLFVAILTYGQNIGHKPLDKSVNILHGKVLFATKYGHNTINQLQSFQDNKNAYKNSWLKAFNETMPGIDSFIVKIQEEGTENREYFYKEEFAYDGWGRLIRAIQHWKEEDGPMKATEQCKYKYNSEGLMTQKFSYSMSEYGGQWEYRDKTDYSYDANGNMIRFVESGYDENSKK